MKKTEFWIWQWLYEVYKGESDIQIACMLRSVHCRTQETYLGKVRMKLVSMYIVRGDFPRAKYHLDKIVSCYLQQGWRLPDEVQNWINEAWVNDTQADSSDGIDYKQYTNAILARGTNTSIAIVTYVDLNRKRVHLIYAEKKHAIVSSSELGVKVKNGSLLELQWIIEKSGDYVVACAKMVDRQALKGISYIKFIEGKISIKESNQFAFVNDGEIKCFINSETIQEYNLVNNDKVSVLTVLDYNKKKENWNWSFVLLIKK